MLGFCPVCEGIGNRPIWIHDSMPILQLVRTDGKLTDDHFSLLEIACCSTCGHIYNRAFDDQLSRRMYSGDFLSNVPVHVSMSKYLEAIANWIGIDSYQGKNVVEIGGGSGHMSRIIAQHARRVLVFEPCAGLTQSMLPETNIALINASFDVGRMDEPADLVICRAVLEHVPEPLNMLAQIHSVLSDDGLLYLEVPRADYINECAALYDLHCAHVQYFNRRCLVELFAKAGFTVVREMDLRDGHDFGFLLSPTTTIAGPFRDRETVPDARVLQESLERRRETNASFLRSLAGSVALYGATWPGLSFLNVHQTDCRFTVTLDDNPDYDGAFLYSREQRVPVRASPRECEGTLDVIIITAYLHEGVIRNKLRQWGFTGQVFCIGGARPLGAI